MTDKPSDPPVQPSDDDLPPEDRPTTARLPQRPADDFSPSDVSTRDQPVVDGGGAAAAQPESPQPQEPAAPQYGSPQYGGQQYGNQQYGAPQYGAPQQPQQSWSAQQPAAPQQPEQPASPYAQPNQTGAQPTAQYGQQPGQPAPSAPEQHGQQPAYGQPQYGQPAAPQQTGPQHPVQNADPNAATAQYGQAGAYGAAGAAGATAGQYAQNTTGQQPYATAPGAPGAPGAGGWNGGPGQPGQPGFGQPQPAKKSSKKLLVGLIAGGAALILIIVAAVVVVNVGNATHSPASAVSAFLDKLKAGQAEAAVKTMSPQPEGDLTLIDDDVYKKAEGQVSSYSINRTSGTTVTARVNYKSGDSSTETFKVTAKGKDFIWDNYVVAGDSLPTVTATASGPSNLKLTVNGKELKPSDDDATTSDYEFVSLPGTYTFDYEGKGVDLLQWETGKVEVKGLSTISAGVSGLDANLEVALSDSGVEAADKAIDAFFQSCFDQGSLTPTGGCGFSIRGTPGVTYTNIKWTVVERPDPDIGDWDGEGFSVVSLFNGHFSVTADASSAAGVGTSSGDVRSINMLGTLKIGDDGAITYETKLS
ncbi:hypothetical protein [Schumannella sp. 10F1B-5-1]|uniref:hypothetical protein n=1 Tax=Schumannella sp. 10F1B-5-1 TaxID=2590780 RepID=UPI0011308832|nr:hypothetical protein [Schumannella sp. 10F1B-5-1]TPW76919.1 hypothetical protein FJ658_03055 [Schumannella sp. 10F1B-5-1]